MDKRVLYEVAIRLVGLFFGVLCIGYLGTFIHTAVYDASDVEYIASWAIPFSILVLACLACVVFAGRLAGFFSRRVATADTDERFDSRSIMQIGLFLIGAYTLTQAIPYLVSAIVRTIEAVREARLAGEFSTTFHGPSGQWISPLVRVLIGASLIFFHARIGALFRRGAKEQQTVDES